MRLFILSWRNLWRNKRRTFITVSSIFFGVILTSLMGSMQEGSYNNMIKNIVNFYSGYIQIHQVDYWENKSINNTFSENENLNRFIDSVEDITLVIPRLESFALASNGEDSKGAMIMGIDPQKENELTSIGTKIIQGNYLKNNDNGVLVGFELATKLKIEPGDTLVLLSQGFHGVTAAGKYPVRGLFKLSNPKLNRQLIYLNLNTAQELFSAKDRLSSIVLMVENNDTMKKILPRLKQGVGKAYSVMSWEEMFPTLLQQIESDRSSGMVMKAILYIVIMFGIFGTVMMMISERKREFGVMMAVGMQKYKLALTVFIETLFMGLLGVTAGFIGCMPIVGYFYNHPVPLTGNGAQWMADLGFEPYMFFAWEPEVFLKQMIGIFLITVFISIFPFIRIVRLNEMNALKG